MKKKILDPNLENKSKKVKDNLQMINYQDYYLPFTYGN